ncbi:hypothetical protein HYPSUDRAFT_198367 [Hypholoma sublateritium FD-334 SS-4]|uniref:Uncharacterized protein n=1 Tax=Hypholoma sublateritium (strain FD-334 SS-4) TaxID=945553 RepID=A0A0D2LHG0_HYPSF|nr:hypothetical protein HYPSUDRAFT_198367 [Hypholoma sublateritium FD-334 SS-4]
MASLPSTRRSTSRFSSRYSSRAQREYGEAAMRHGRLKKRHGWLVRGTTTDVRVEHQGCAPTCSRGAPALQRTRSQRLARSISFRFCCIWGFSQSARLQLSDIPPRTEPPGPMCISGDMPYVLHAPRLQRAYVHTRSGADMGVRMNMHPPLLPGMRGCCRRRAAYPDA